MKRTYRLTTVAGASALAVLLSNASTSYGQGRMYMRADGGANWTMNTKLDSFFGELLSPGTEVKFDPGLRLGFVAGCEVTDWFSAEGEFGVYANHVESITGANRVDDVTFSNVPFLVNARFQLPGKRVVTPYIGGGLGMSIATIDADNLDIGSTTMTGFQNTVVFAYQGFAGLQFRINDEMGVALEYHYFGTSDAEWEADATFGTGSDKMRFDGTETHAVSIAFHMRF